ncbi:MAG: sigma-54-dependent Fis family transcriptional regulator [Bacteroidales bacterium]|nr:sigma-54-dependent Fis family transcriptional regulator [Bacteroidales bacterium]MBQ2493394.1 sigma-54-dependent Fis family transcriptional regulator [Bacteroidales bacterium]MBQ4196964.1 sigma-54-dependent Fis family transcriptional regulator [Bacteroidales bacterium]
MKKGKILVVDDNAGIRSALKILLPSHFAQVELLASPSSLMTRLRDFRPEVVLLDMNFSADINTGNEGLFWLGEIRKAYPQTKVVLFTAYADVALAVEGMKRGAYDFIVKPWENEKLIEILTGAYKASVSESGGKAFDSSCSDGGDSSSVQMFWGNTPAMVSLKRIVDKVAATDATVLITGENGTGKDVLARYIHSLSQRCGRIMVSVDAGAVPESLFESELFGHVKGSFTDAIADHKGKFEAADGGTLFLDEIGNIPLSSQAKLLRAIQNRSISKVGDNKIIPVDIRLICATNRNLPQLVADGLFREDLFYRINAFHLHIPALRERAEDIVPLATMFLKKFSDKYHRDVSGMTEEARVLLTRLSWSGNIRQLQNVIEKAVILSDGPVLDASAFSDELSDSAEGETESSGKDVFTLEEAEKQAIASAMKKYGDNLSLVAKALDISRPTLYNKLKKYGL